MDTAVETLAVEIPDTDSRGGMRRWVLRRLAFTLVTLLIVSALIFVATQVLPSDPASSILGREATPERIAALNDRLGLEKPLLTQYREWLGGAVTGDFGDSLASNLPVLTVIGDRAANTAILVSLAMLLAMPISLGVGILAATKKDRTFDHLAQVLTLIFNAIPEFVVGMLLVTLFSTTVLTILPAVTLLSPGETVFAQPDSLILPTLTLVIVVVAYLARLVRASVIDVLESEYVQMARLKGLSERTVLIWHALPNALVPAIQGTALTVAYLAGGIVVIEYLFGYPGLGSALTDAVGNQDVPVIQATTLILAAVVVVSNLIADILSLYLSPRALRRVRSGD